MRSSKLQAPSSRETPNYKLQRLFVSFSLGLWCLELLWSLELRAWGFGCLFACVLAAGAGESNSQSERDHTGIALEALSRLKGIDLEANPAVKAAVLKTLEQVRGTPQFVEIVRDFKIKGQGTALLELA